MPTSPALTAGVDDLPPPVRKKKENVAEAIENNVRRLIIDETPVNPKFYEKMSELLTDLVKQRRDEAIAYAEYLEKIADLVRQVKKGHGVEYPNAISTPGKKALYDNLNGDESLALSVDETIRQTAQQGWRGNKMKERMLQRKLAELIENDDDLDRVFEIIKAQNEY